MFMCYKHWRMVPKDLQRMIWKYYRPGQCDDWKPSLEYCTTAPISASEISSLVSIRLREWKIQYVDGRFESIGLQTDMRLSTIRRIVLHGVAEYDPF